MKKKITNITIILSLFLMLIKNEVFAKSSIKYYSGDFYASICIEIFSSILMIVFILLPLVKAIDKNKPALTFFILFIIRIVLLIIGNSIDSTTTSIIDLLIIIIAPFFVIPFIKWVTKELEVTSSNDYQDVPKYEFDNIGIKNIKILKKDLIGKFIKYEKAYCNEDYTYLKKNTSNNLYKMLNYTLKLSKENGIKNMTTNIKEIDSKICSINNTKERIEICMYLKVSLLDYTTDLTGNVTEGSSKNKKISEYILVFEKINPKKLNNLNCINCGSPIKENTKDYCEYCGSLLDAVNYNWVIKKCNKLK